MKTTITAIFMASMLAACNGGGDSGPSVESVTVNDSYSTVTVTRSSRYDLDINGMKNTVTVTDNQQIDELNLNGSGHTLNIGKGANIGTMNLVGVSSDITLQPGFSVSKIIYTGAGITIHIPAGATLPPATGSGVDLKIIAQ